MHVYGRKIVAMSGNVYNVARQRAGQQVESPFMGSEHRPTSNWSCRKTRTVLIYSLRFRRVRRESIKMPAVRLKSRSYCRLRVAGLPGASNGWRRTNGIRVTDSLHRYFLLMCAQSSHSQLNLILANCTRWQIVSLSPFILTMPDARHTMAILFLAVELTRQILAGAVSISEELNLACNLYSRRRMAGSPLDLTLTDL